MRTNAPAYYKINQVMGQIEPGETKVIGITSNCKLIEGDPSALTHKFLVESMEAQGNEALTSQLFSESRDVRRHTLPVIYRKRYVGQPAFESRTPVRSRTESRRSDISAINERGRLSRVTEGIVEAPILEQATVEDVKDDAKQSTKLVLILSL
eukprot:TRINITY_DN4296_c0_g1_i11.p1 TRINITY_DN4296_c0_g1~~TRINITY_DN4296_c0_g1_i11.p1  ORF type:complete len:153 (+),score=37.58 TRINITY_DN4296_c0_g1_i11:231-689(+)